MCGIDKGGWGTKKQPKLGLLTTQRKTDVPILINFISISLSHCRIYVQS